MQTHRQAERRDKANRCIFAILMLKRPKIMLLVAQSDVSQTEVDGQQVHFCLSIQDTVKLDTSDSF
jgi:hypothetical protein